ncbi:MAG: sugar phosphate isomerase/epimerase [Bacteroidales bacterium]|jgi:sugar phosphate isomerase/epimerase|nr:sugar phosphate isomerase/epimerase [Bacteroidales bacterium]MCU0408314.1 sugar phosphate isomerase/epimerase [Bacteroidales bacterium]
MITRRKFISGTTAAVVLSPLALDLFAAPQGKKIKNFGFISGIIGKELETDWKGTLKKAASFGFTEIETGNFMGNSPEEFLSYLDEVKIKLVAGGFEFKVTDEDLKKSLDLLVKLKAKIAIVYWPWYTGAPFSLTECRKSAERLNFLGKACRDKGMEFAWHNHDKEFVAMEEGLPFDFLMQNTDPGLVKCELDIYWAAKGGADPVGLMKKYPGRYNILHIKDMAPGTAMDFECPGSGIIDFPAVFRESDRQGIKHFMIERDNVPDGLACMKSAGEYLRNLRY